MYLQQDDNQIGKPVREVFYRLLKSPLGNMIGCASGAGLISLLFEKEAIDLMTVARLNKGVIFCESEIELLIKLDKQLKAYFAGSLKSFDIALDTHGTLFQKDCWSCVQKIPYGSTRTYKELAIEIGDGKSTRAVASANARNTILLLIPCHRVIGTGNKLTGYRGGIQKKQWLLEFERNNAIVKNEYLLF